MPKPGDSITTEFVTSAASTGAATNADSLPTAALARNGTDDGTVTVTVTNIDAGRYKAAWTIPVGYAAGDEVVLIASATIGGTAAKAKVWEAQLDTKRFADVIDANGDISAKLGAAGQQTVIQLIEHTNKAYLVRTDGSGADGLSVATAYTSVHTAATTASGVAGSEIVVGPGTFTETSNVALAQYGRLIGAGTDRTLIANASTVNSSIVVLASNSLVSGLQVQGTAGASNFQYAIGDNGSTIANAVVCDFHGGADSDGAYLAGTNSTARFYRCIFTSDWDCAALQQNTGIVAEFFNCYFRTVGPNAESANISSTINVAAGNTLRAYDSHIVNTATNVNTSRTTKVVLAGGSTTAGGGARIELYNTTIETNLSSTETVRHIQVGINATVLLQNCTYDPGKVALDLSITGTPTGGTFGLTVVNGLGSQTATINYNDNAAAVQADLQALSNVGAGKVIASGGTLPGGTITLVFDASLGPVTLTTSSAALTGGASPAAVVGTLIVQNCPINQAGQIAAGVLATNAIGQIVTATWTDLTGSSDFGTNNSIGKLFVTNLDTNVGSRPTAAQNATAIWQDLTAGSDFTTAGSIGKLITTNLDTNVASRLASSSYSVSGIVTAIWQDLTSSADFTTNGSIGKLLSGYTTPPTVAQIATGIFTDTTAGDFTTAASLGKLVNQWTAMVNATPAFTTSALANAPAGGGGTGGSAGDGNTPVNENTGGAGNLLAQQNGHGIGECSIKAYVASEWAANPLTATLRAQAWSKDDGTWATVMMLNSGVTYTFVFDAAGFVIQTVNVTV